MHSRPEGEGGYPEEGHSFPFVAVVVDDVADVVDVIDIENVAVFVDAADVVVDVVRNAVRSWLEIKR